MALMVPEFISSNASQGEQILYKIFREKLSNDFLIWHNQIVLENCLNFVIIAPTLGVLILEVIPWYPSQIISADSNTIQVLYSQKEKTQKIEDQQSLSSLDIPGRRKRKRSPQAKLEIESEGWNIDKYQKLLDNLSGKLENFQILTQLDEKFQNKLLFPVGYGFVFSNITWEQGQEKNIEQVLPKSQIIYRNELLSLQNANNTSLVDRLKTIFIKNFDFPSLSYQQIDTIKASIFPERAIKLIPVLNDSTTHNIQLNRSYLFQTLDHHQESIVTKIGEGHRIIYGVAGSGKTLILVCHAKLLINQNPEQKILLICFNRTLAAYLKSILYYYLESQNIISKIEVLTFYSWVNSVMPKIPAQSGFSTEYYDGILGDILLEKLSKIPNSQKYDAILIDEAQTFHPTWFKCCVAALKDPENGNLLIVADGSQSIYKRSDFTWKSVGIKAVGRTSNKRINLDKNYRNTHEILTAAWGLFSNYHTNYENLIFDIVKPIDALRHGLHPILHIEKSEKHEIKSVIREIQELKNSGYDLNEMAIIYRMADDKKTVLIDNLIRELNKLQLASYWVSQSRINEKQYSNKNYVIKIISSLSALGLEFKIVFIIWVQDWEFSISPVSESDILTCKRLYVAMTRAQDILHIFGSGNSRLLKQLQNSEHFTIKQ